MHEAAPGLMVARVWLFLAKLLIAPTFVALVTLIGRRLGPAAAGFVAALPVVGGPIVALMAVEHGARFGASAAFGCAIGTASTMLFALVYARVVRHVSQIASVLLAYGGFFVGTALASQLPIHVFTAIVVPAFAWRATLGAFPAASLERPGIAPPRWDLPMRMLATAALVVSLTSVAELLGPALSGLLAPFPIATAVLAVFARREAGPDTAIVLLRSLVRGLASFTSFFVVLGLALPRMPMLTGG